MPEELYLNDRIALASELHRIAGRLVEQSAAHDLDKRDLIKRASDLLADRQRWVEIVGKRLNLSGDSAWSLLLALYVARGDGKILSVNEVVSATDVPATTASRVFTALVANGLVVRAIDPADSRRIMLQLTECGVEMLERYLEA